MGRLKGAIAGIGQSNGHIIGHRRIDAEVAGEVQ
nr:hypothetical protein [uncultured bacterium]